MFFSPYRPVGKWRSVLVWSKGEHTGIGGDRLTCWKRDFELIGVSNNDELAGFRDTSVLRFMATRPRYGHVCEKPVDLICYLLRKLGGESVCDPFMGTGTTLRAAKDLGRRAIGIEIEEKYCEIAAKRLSQEVFDFS
jgi:site-specific DNA-methyltransferase (adenine-specific)